ncbi:UDP-N-acetylmuramoyl-tripeptide--D-alanyl-D-alanine ligase [[Eubacterium] hominis]|uniref:UDP-N-acetylmuramoyl-tripeptide--D-alanyl-D- alanine ligase n=1 Tax=[Eubacterium] hominis TaxID=2764325 RepID=UPI003A4D6AFD
MREIGIDWFILLCYSFVMIKYSTMILQQNHYHMDRYIHWLKMNWFQKKTVVITLLLCLMYVTLILDKAYQKEVILLAMAVVAYLAYKLDREIHYRLPLKLTHRVKRLLLVRILLYLIFACIMCRLSETLWVYLTPWFFWLPFFELILSMLLISPLEEMIQRYYVEDAKEILKKRNDLTIIGITGSYGKTSVKTILYTLLSDEFDTLMTPKSFNNKMGITLTIRNSLKGLHQLFLCEMGADHVGEILSLMHFVKPQIGIVTAIGPQHLSTFHSMDNIVREKMYMIEELPAGGIGFLNADNSYIRSHPLACSCRMVWFGKDPISDYRIVNIQPNATGTNFTIQYKEHHYDFTTCLLGEHNVYNLCAAIAVTHELGVSFEVLKQRILLVPFIKHRLQIVSTQPYTLIDDAYNANPQGAHYACQVLKQMKERTIIVTPGMIELGAIEDQANKDFGKEMAECVDDVILVGIKQTKKIKEGLLEQGFEESHLFVCKDFTTALDTLKHIVKNGDVVLLENDLPDAFSH